MVLFVPGAPPISSDNPSRFGVLAPFPVTIRDGEAHIDGQAGVHYQVLVDGEQIIDVTSKGPDPWVRFSPFYPHGGIPVPFSPGEVAASVEGIWQGLKVFENADVDPTSLANTKMKGIQRASTGRFAATEPVC